MRQTITRLVLSFVAIGITLSAANTQDYPSRPIRLIVPFPPGGGVDVAARLIGEKLGDALGQQVVIDNRPGASGTLGAQVVAKAAPDGYTLLFSAGDFVTVPSMMPHMAFDPYKELAPVTMVSSNPLAVVANVTAPLTM